MGDDAIKKLARVQAVEGAVREEALGRALRDEKLAAQEVQQAQALKQEAKASHAARKAALLETGPICAEELLRRADDFESSRASLRRREELEAQKLAAFTDAQAASQQSRIAWADSKAREKALARKVHAAQKREHENCQGREDD